MAKGDKPAASAGDFEAKDRRHPSESAILDPNTLDEQFHYRFIQERPTSVARARLKGYQTVKPEETGEQTLFGQEDGNAENIIKHGDRILMKVPKARHAQHRRRVQERAVGRLRTADERVRETARESGIKLHEKDEDDD